MTRKLVELTLFQMVPQLRDFIKRTKWKNSVNGTDMMVKLCVM